MTGRGGRRGRRGGCRARRRAGGVHPELPQRVAVRGGAGGAVHPDVAAGPGDRQGLGAAGAGGGRVDRGPVRPVGRDLDLERGRVGRLPVQRHLADRLAGAEVDLQPLRVGEGAGPAGAGVAVHRRRRRERRVLQRGRRGGLVQRGVRGAAGGAGAARRAVDLELPQRVPVLGGAGGAVHPDVAAGAGDVEGLRAAGAGGGGVDRGPVGAVGGGLDLERGRVGRLPLQHHLADRRGRAEIHLQPLRVAERAGPAGAGVAVHRRRRGERRVLARTTRSRSCPCESRVAASALWAVPASNAAVRASAAAMVTRTRNETGRKRAAERMTSPGERGDRRSTSLDLRLKFDRNLMAGNVPSRVSQWSTPQDSTRRRKFRSPMARNTTANPITTGYTTYRCMCGASVNAARMPSFT